MKSALVPIRGVGPIVTLGAYLLGVNPSPQTKGVLWGLSVGSFLIGALDHASGGAYLGDHKEYPVIRPSNTYGYLKTTKSSLAPPSIYNN